MSELWKVADGQVIEMEYTLQVDDETIDTSAGHGPIEFIQGIGNIVPGLEQALYGMSVGDSKDVIVAAVDGNFEPFETLVKVLARPYDNQPEFAYLADPPLPEERVCATFCGT